MYQLELNCRILVTYCFASTIASKTIDREPTWVCLRGLKRKVWPCYCNPLPPLISKSDFLLAAAGGGAVAGWLKGGLHVRYLTWIEAFLALTSWESIGYPMTQMDSARNFCWWGRICACGVVEEGGRGSTNGTLRGTRGDPRMVPYDIPWYKCILQEILLWMKYFFTLVSFYLHVFL